MKTKLFRYPILALTLALSNLTINPPAANAQSIQSINYFCQSYRGGFATVGRSSLGVRSIITWDSRQPVCNTVSGRFQVARDNGNLRFLMREENRVCGTNMYGGECRNLLFAADNGTNANDLWRRLMNNNTIDSRFITQSAGREYFNLELYLETVPIPTNQEISEN